MPAVSQNQQMVAGLADAIQNGGMTPQPGTISAQMAASMKPAAVKEFARPPHAGLPKKKKLPPVKRVGKHVKKEKF